MGCRRQPALNGWRYFLKGIMTPSIARRHNPVKFGVDQEIHTNRGVSGS